MFLEMEKESSSLQKNHSKFVLHALLIDEYARHSLLVFDVHVIEGVDVYD